MKLKLSEAIRLGAMLRPQAHGAFFEDGRSCAIGSAMEAIGIRPMVCSKRSPEIDAAFEQMRQSFPLFTFWMALRIIWKNDVRRWSRERIAAWVAEREPKEVAKQADPVEADTERQLCATEISLR